METDPSSRKAAKTEDCSDVLAICPSFLHDFKVPTTSKPIHSPGNQYSQDG
jgi:hypothetical protein